MIDGMGGGTPTTTSGSSIARYASRRHQFEPNFGGGAGGGGGGIYPTGNMVEEAEDGAGAERERGFSAHISHKGADGLGAVIPHQPHLVPPFLWLSTRRQAYRQGALMHRARRKVHADGVVSHFYVNASVIKGSFLSRRDQDCASASARHQRAQTNFFLRNAQLLPGDRCT